MQLSEKLFRRTLAHVKHGRVELIPPSGQSQVFGDPGAALRATLVVENPRFFSRALLGGDDGAGDAFVDGDWWSDDLVSLIRIAVKNLGTLNSGLRWTSGVSRLLYRLRHASRDNTVDGSRRNIAEHYDLSNDFFRLFLDSKAMMYSCAIFEDENESLEQAQLNKLDHICQKLGLGPDDHVLEIGTGWGGFAERAVTKFGCRVTTTTISRQQHDAAQARFERAGIQDRVELLLEDYRKLRGQYDKIVSIEMFEAVGLDHYDEFFGACQRLLKPEGSMLFQTITMNEQRFPQYHRESDWIQRRIFPGAELASISEVLKSVGRTTSLTLMHAEDIGVHYSLTLAEWRRRFHEAREEVLRLNFDERFLRMWDYYLAFCEGAFRERYIGDAQILLTRIHNPQTILGDPGKILTLRSRNAHLSN